MIADIQSYIQGDKDILLNYEMTNFLGQGNNYVYEVMEKSSREKYALKMFQLNNDDIDNFKKEVQILEKLRHSANPNIINYVSSCLVEKKEQFNNPEIVGYILMEKGITSVEKFIRRKKENKEIFDLKTMVRFIRQMIDAHVHMQQNHIAHRDIKPDNILIFNQKDNYVDFKVCDVGVGTFSNNSTKTRTLIGTLTFLSPELFKSYASQKSGVHYNPFKSDVFSLGLVILYFATFQKIVGSDRSNMSIHQYLQRLQEIKQIALEKYSEIDLFKELLDMMLLEDENKRADFIQIQEFLKNKDFYSNILYKDVTVQKEEFLEIDQIVGVEALNNLLEMPTTDRLYINSLDIDLYNNKLNKNEVVEKFGQALKYYQNLKKLKLNLELNQIQKQQMVPFADSIKDLQKLHYLELLLWNNNIQDSTMQQILSNIFQLKNLKQLYINASVNGLTDQFLLGLENLQNFQMDYLEVLCLDFSLNGISSQNSAQSTKTLCQLIQKIKNLQKLDLNFEYNCIKLHGIKNIMSSIEKLEKLDSLSINVSYNEVSDNGIYSLCDYLESNGKYFTSEVKLFLPGNFLSDKFVKHFSISVKNLMNISSLTLWINNNNFGDKNIPLLSESLEQLVNLQNLNINLSYIDISDPSIKLLSLSFLKLNKLKTLKLLLDRISITNQGVKYISSFISEKNELSNLALSLNSIKKIDSLSLVYLGLALSNLNVLRQLSLSLQGVPLQQDGFKQLAESYNKLHCLEQFQFQFTECSIDFVSAQSLFSKVKSIPKLNNFYVCLKGNNISEADQEALLNNLKSHFKENQYTIKF